MLRRKTALPPPEVVNHHAGEDALWDKRRDVPPSKDELSPRELMTRLTAEVGRKMDAAFGRGPRFHTE